MGLLAIPTLVSELTAIVDLTTTAVRLIQTLSLFPAAASVSLRLLGRSWRGWVDWTVRCLIGAFSRVWPAGLLRLNHVGLSSNKSAWAFR